MRLGVLRERLRSLLAGDARQAGWGAALLIAPHFVLGLWLLIVPDHLAFGTNQLVTLVHVALGVVAVPTIVLWIVRHATRRGRRRRGLVSRSTSWVLVGTGTIAIATGAWVTWGGEIVPAHPAHASSGLLVGAALVLHLWTGRQRAAALGVAGLLVLATAGADLALELLPPQSLEAPSLAFAFEPKRSELYEPAASCGECHVEQYAEWSRSTHGRTMENPLFVNQMAKQTEWLGFDISDYRELVEGKHPRTDGEAALQTCERCHTPTTFYGDDKQDPLKPTGIAREGITCSFCHTMRGVRDGLTRNEPLPADLDRTNWGELVKRLPYYVSAPETVRRYFGQGSRSQTGRWLANALIRWRPSVHRQDMRPPALDSAASCLPCHANGDFDQLAESPQKVYFAWERSHYNTGDPATTVTCQDCHMARELTGTKPQEPGRFVPWGPVRRHHSSHYFLGGNREIPDRLNDPEHARREHELNMKVADISVVATRREGNQLFVEVEAVSRLVGHYLPSISSANRWLWVEITALDEAGQSLAVTRRPTQQMEPEPEAAVIYRCVDPPRPNCDTVLVPGEPRLLTARLPLPPEARPAKLVATLYHSLDPEPLRTLTVPYPLPPRSPAAKTE
jgi:hypothetical protein